MSGRLGLFKMAWRAWMFSVGNRMQFAANTFGLIALGILFEGLNDLALAEAAEKPVEQHS
jgi:hypothetical protein